MADGAVVPETVPRPSAPAGGAGAEAVPKPEPKQPDAAAFEATLVRLNEELADLQQKRDKAQARIAGWRSTNDELNVRVR